MDMPMPNVVTTLKKSDYNFEFRVLAYRKLSEAEMYAALKLWMRQSKTKTIPKNKTVTYQSIIGFDE